MDVRPYFERAEGGTKQSPRGPYQIYKNGNDYYAVDPQTGSPITTGVTKTNLINRMNGAEPLGIEKAADAAKSSTPSKRALNIAMEESMVGTQEQRAETEAAIKAEPTGKGIQPEEIEDVMNIAK